MSVCQVDDIWCQFAARYQVLCRKDRLSYQLRSSCKATVLSPKDFCQIPFIRNMTSIWAADWVFVHRIRCNKPFRTAPRPYVLIWIVIMLRITQGTCRLISSLVRDSSVAQIQIVSSAWPMFLQNPVWETTHCMQTIWGHITCGTYGDNMTWLAIIPWACWFVATWHLSVFPHLQTSSITSTCTEWKDNPKSGWVSVL